MIWAAFTLAFFAFLRCNEFTYPGANSFSSRFNLTTDCVTFYPSLACPQRLLVTLKSSKTDVFRHGRSLIIACCSSLPVPSRHLGPSFPSDRVVCLLGPPSRTCLGILPAVRDSLMKVSRAIVFASVLHPPRRLLVCQTG